MHRSAPRTPAYRDRRTAASVAAQAERRVPPVAIAPDPRVACPFRCAIATGPPHTT